MEKMKQIELHLKYHVSVSGQIGQLGTGEYKAEWRVCGLSVEWIEMYYPHTNGGTMIIVAGSDYLFRESYDEVKELLNAIKNEQ